MKIFNLLVVATISVVIVYFLVTLLVIPEDSFYGDFTSASIEALANPGKPVPLVFSMKGEDALNSKTLAENSLFTQYDGILFYFKVNDELVDKININDRVESEYYIFTATALNPLRKKDATVICNPYISFISGAEQEDYSSEIDFPLLDEYNYFCEIVFGAKIDHRVTASLDSSFITNKTKGEHIQKLTLNHIPVGLTYRDYIAKVYIFETELDYNNLSEEIYFLGSDYLDSFKEMNVFNFSNNTLEFTLDFDYAGKYVLLYSILPKATVTENLFAKGVIGPAFYISENVRLSSSESDLMKGCVATDFSISHYDFGNERCVSHYNCNGCILPSLCVAAWAKKGVDVESNNNDYAEGYSSTEDCDVNPDEITVTKDPVMTSGSINWPTIKKNVSSCFGFRHKTSSTKERNHTGIDIGGKRGDPIYAITDGKVIFSGGSYNTIKVDHGNYISEYLHLDKINVDTGESVTKGQQIGEMGGYGPQGRFAYATHLHFELLFKNATPVRIDDSYKGEDVFLLSNVTGSLAVNPLCYFDASIYSVSSTANGSGVCEIQGGPEKWCSYYENYRVD